MYGSIGSATALNSGPKLPCVRAGNIDDIAWAAKERRFPSPSNSGLGVDQNHRSGGWCFNTGRRIRTLSFLASRAESPRLAERLQDGNRIPFAQFDTAHLAAPLHSYKPVSARPTRNHVVGLQQEIFRGIDVLAKSSQADFYRADLLLRIDHRVRQRDGAILLMPGNCDVPRSIGQQAAHAGQHLRQSALPCKG